MRSKISLNGGKQAIRKLLLLFKFSDLLGDNASVKNNLKKEKDNPTRKNIRTEITKFRKKLNNRKQMDLKRLNDLNAIQDIKRYETQVMNIPPHEEDIEAVGGNFIRTKEILLNRKTQSCERITGGQSNVNGVIYKTHTFRNTLSRNPVTEGYQIKKDPSVSSPHQGGEGLIVPKPLPPPLFDPFIASEEYSQRNPANEYSYMSFPYNIPKKSKILAEHEKLIAMKRKFFRINQRTSMLDKRDKDNIPINLPEAEIKSYTYSNNSERCRHEKVTQLFLKLRYFVKNDPDNDKFLIKEFMLKNGIYDEEYYEIDKLTNFSNFLESDFSLDPKKTMKELILEATKFDKDEYELRKINGKENIIVQCSDPTTERTKISSQVTKRNRTKEKDLYDYFSLEEQKKMYHNNAFKIDPTNQKAVIDYLENEIQNLNNEFQFRANEQNNKIINKAQNNINHLPSIEGNHQVKETSKSEMLGRRGQQEKSDRGLISISEIKKKNKLLEYIYLQRAKTKYLLEQW